jgi:hypothetical protein
MAASKGIPHDLVQYVIEAATGYWNGFWDLVSQGATFRSTGRRRTKPGREVIAKHRAELAGAEKLAGTLLAHWRTGDVSTGSQALSGRSTSGASCRPAERLVYTWPSATGTVVNADRF